MFVSVFTGLVFALVSEHISKLPDCKLGGCEGSQETIWMKPLGFEGNECLAVQTEAVPGCFVSESANSVWHILFIAPNLDLGSGSSSPSSSRGDCTVFLSLHRLFPPPILCLFYLPRCNLIREGIDTCSLFVDYLVPCGPDLHRFQFR